MPFSQRLAGALERGALAFPALWAFNRFGISIVGCEDYHDPNQRLLLLVDRFSPEFFNSYSLGRVYTLRSPDDPDRVVARRLMHKAGDWVKSAKGRKQPMHMVPKGFGWVEMDREAQTAKDSKDYGSVPLALLEGNGLFVCWPPSRFGVIAARAPSEKAARRRRG